MSSIFTKNEDVKKISAFVKKMCLLRHCHKDQVRNLSRYLKPLKKQIITFAKFVKYYSVRAV